VTRHANARRVEVSLIRRPGAVSLRVSDDGRGISTETAGAGIRGMRERAIFVGGTLTVGPGPDAVPRCGSTCPWTEEPDAHRHPHPPCR
jgi:two-component system, NarL family, sensor histidine kinase UhpB